MLKDYRTPGGPACSELVIKKSRFIAHVRPVLSENVARTCLQDIRTSHRDASHNVYAYNVTTGVAVQRYSDDGEPQGTAGLPVMQAIKKANLMNTLIVVSRYFGGKLLGASGLARAYGKAAALGIGQAGITRKVLCTLFNTEIEYQCMGAFQNTINEKGFPIIDTVYTDSVNLVVAVPYHSRETFFQILSRITSGSGKATEGKHAYMDFNT